MAIVTKNGWEIEKVIILGKLFGVVTNQFVYTLRRRRNIQLSSNVIHFNSHSIHNHLAPSLIGPSWAMTLPISTTRVHCHHPSLLPSITSHLNPKHTNNDELLRLFRSIKPTRLTPTFTSLRAASAISDSHYSVVLAATNPPMSGDISVILKTRFVFFIFFLQFLLFNVQLFFLILTLLMQKLQCCDALHVLHCKLFRSKYYLQLQVLRIRRGKKRFKSKSLTKKFL